MAAVAGVLSRRQATVRFGGSSLTDEPFETYYGDRRLQGRYEKFGRRFLIGAGFEF